MSRRFSAKFASLTEILLRDCRCAAHNNSCARLQRCWRHLAAATRRPPVTVAAPQPAWTEPAMRLSRSFIPTMKETPAEAQIVSHRLMLRAGLVRQTSAGIYAWLPLGFRVLQQHRADRARGAGRGRRAGSADADDPAGRAVARERALRRLRQGDAAHPRPARARHAVRADQRGDDHRPVPPVGASRTASCRRSSTTSSGSSATRCGRASA